MASKDSQKGRGLGLISPGAAGFLTLVLLAVGLTFTGGVNLVKDISALVSDKDGSSMANLAREWGLMQRVLVVVGPMEPGSPELIEAVDKAKVAVEGVRGIGDVTWKVDTEKARQGAEAIVGSGVRLFRSRIDQVDEEEVKARLRALKERLASPEAMVIQDYLLADPLGLARGALGGLEAMGSSMGASVVEGRLMSKDSRYALVTAKLDFDPMDVERSAGFVEELDAALAKALDDSDGEMFFALGGPHFAASSARTITKDIQVAFILTGVGILLVFVLFFRRIFVLPVALLPGGIGIIAALGVFGYMGKEVHALTVGFAATITGISIDYSIHLLYRALHKETGTSKVRMRQALNAVARPVVLGCATTVAAFALVATSSFPGMRQLALFSVISIPVALGATLFLVPAFHRILLGSKPSRPGVADRYVAALARMGAGNPSKVVRMVVIGVFICVAGGGGLGLWRVETTGDPRALGAVDEELDRRRERVEEIFPGLFGQTLVVAEGEYMDAALQTNDELYEQLLGAGVESSEIVSLSPVLPSLKTQDESLLAARALYTAPAMEKVFKEAGFTDGFFQGLSKGLKVEPILARTYAGTPLENLVRESVNRSGQKARVLTRVKGNSEERLALLSRVADGIDGCAVISERLEAARALDSMRSELISMLGIWFLAALVLLSVAKRSPLFGLRACVPAVFGLLCAAGLFGILGRPLTPVAAAALTLVMGLGIDYGIFVQSFTKEGVHGVAPAVTASAFTTLAAFGVLVSAGTRAMADMGLIVLVGVAAAMVASLILVPVLGGGRGRKEVGQ